MKRKFPNVFLFFPISLILLLFVSCGPAVLPVAQTPTLSPISEMLATPSSISTVSPNCPPENWPCPSDSMTLTAVMEPTLAAMSSSTQDNLTAAMGATLDAIPTNTPPSWATVIPAVGDLGWGSVYGIISDAATNFPLEGATVKCEHSSYTSPYPCKGVTTTNSDGIYSFTPVFFHDTDRITLIVEAPGYVSLRFEQPSFTRPELHADLGLFPVTNSTPTPTPFLMCTPPPCSGGALVCGVSSGCPGGCGSICMPATPTP